MTLRTRRIAFGCFAAALFIGTHYPNLRVSVPHVDRPDLIIHMSVFAVWYALLLAAEIMGPWHRTRSIAFCALIACMYACFDESSQSLSVLNRTAAMDDLLANLAGISLAALLALAASSMRSRRHDLSPTDHPSA